MGLGIPELVDPVAPLARARVRGWVRVCEGEPVALWVPKFPSSVALAIPELAIELTHAGDQELDPGQKKAPVTSRRIPHSVTRWSGLADQVENRCNYGDSDQVVADGEVHRP